MLGNGTLPLNAAALDANRAGQLTSEQLANLRRYDRSTGRGNKMVIVFCVILAIVLLTSRAGGNNAARPFLAVGALAVAAYLVLRSFGIGSRLATDLRSVRVEAIEGAIARSHAYMGGNANVYSVEVAGESFRVFRGTYDAVPDAGIVRLYYLPNSRHVVNMERLADPPLPQGVLDSPMAALKSLSSTLFSRDREARAEARATLAAMQSAMQVERSRQATPPPPDQRDPRPLGEAILGRWRTGPMSLDFTPDGTVTAILPGGVERRGRWSVDAAGRLHADALGEEQVGDAWVVGDSLTLAADGDALTFRRA